MLNQRNSCVFEKLQGDVAAFNLTLCTQTESLTSEISPLNFLFLSRRITNACLNERLYNVTETLINIPEFFLDFLKVQIIK